MGILGSAEKRLGINGVWKREGTNPGRRKMALVLVQVKVFLDMIIDRLKPMSTPVCP